MKNLLALALVFYASCALAQTDSQKQWDQLVAAAQKEGKVVILGPPDQAVREGIPAAFKARYGITVDYIGGRSSESAAKLRAERQAGIYSLNTAQVKPEEIKTAQDLLNPKFKGKIVVHDPTVPGTGSNDAARLYVQFGEDYVKKLYIDQKPMILRDRRQITDALVRGAYPIALGAEDGDLERLRKEGVPLHFIYSLSDLPGSLSAGIGQAALFNHAPHPNAAKLFINWIASKEGLEVFARARGEAPTRNDIDALAFLPPESVPKPGVKYFDTYEWEFTLSTKEKIRARMGELLKQ